MAFVKEKIPEEEKENFDLKKLRHRLLPRQVTKDRLSLWIADKETGAFLVMLGGVGPRAPGRCYAFCWKQWIVNIYCERRGVKNKNGSEDFFFVIPDKYLVLPNEWRDDGGLTSEGEEGMSLISEALKLSTGYDLSVCNKVEVIIEKLE